MALCSLSISHSWRCVAHTHHSIMNSLHCKVAGASWRLTILHMSKQNCICLWLTVKIEASWCCALPDVVNMFELCAAKWRCPDCSYTGFHVHHNFELYAARGNWSDCSYNGFEPSLEHHLLFTECLRFMQQVGIVQTAATMAFTHPLYTMLLALCPWLSEAKRINAAQAALHTVQEL